MKSQKNKKAGKSAPSAGKKKAAAAGAAGKGKGAAKGKGAKGAAKSPRRSGARPAGRGAVAVAVETLPQTDLKAPSMEGLISGLIRPQSTVTSGPRKERAKGPHAPRLSNHKVRSAWFQNRASWPVREAPTRALVRERALVKKTLPPAPGVAKWTSVGPTNIGGRVTSLVCHPHQPERLWAGAAGGGVWHSPDGGQTWQSQWHDQDILNVGSLALDPEKPHVIYCGTGEANLSADSYPGVGIYRTTDEGKTWHLHASTEKTGIPQRIGVIAVDPFDPKHIRIGGVGYAEMGGRENDLGGMYFSLDGGVTWKRETFISAKNYWCHSVVFHPTRKGFIFATFTARGVRNGIYQSKDGGKSWKQLTAGLPDPDRMGRTSLAISPSDPDIMYAYAADEASGSADFVLGVFRSDDGGATWANTAGSHFAEEGQTSYNNAIAVHPTNPAHVICGGVDLHLTTDGGKNWRQVTRWDADRGDPDYAHADHHSLLMPAAKPGRIYDVNDGGLDVSEDGGKAWVNRSNGLAVTMYYDMDTAQSNEKFFGGGAQDNGTLITTTGGSGDHFELLGGDGGWIVFDPTDEGHVYASYQRMGIFRFREGGYKKMSLPTDPDERNSVWMCYIAMDPNNPKIVFTGSYRVWRTQNDGDKWAAVSAPLDGSAITAIEIASADSQRIYVGTENGNFFRSLNGGDKWSSNMSSPTLPGHTITRLAADPRDADVLFATVANFGHSHVFRSRDGGENWEDSDHGQLPDVPHHSIVIPQDSPDTIYVCNDVGVFVSPDSGETWMNLTGNLPNVMVVDLAYHAGAGTLSAATYGRSIWRLQIKPSWG